MALEDGLNSILQTLNQLPGISSVVKIFQIAGVVIIIYFVVMMIRTILQYRYAKNLSSIARNVEEINKKMDNFLNSKKKK